MTIAMLIENTMKSAKTRVKKWAMKKIKKI
jgi:5,10-methylene-tetrahydrofolate dehydrogenase/methenyl tetrahydrofolate cyclohydrolase